nr:ABC transporter ATP-binding protein [Methylobacterium brachythecii]
MRIDGVTKTFGAHRAVDAVSLDLAAGEFLCLLGPSGCGKSTLLRMLAGFETPDAGAITLHGQDLIGLPPHQRPVNMMFQSYALFPHMSVAKNLAYGLQGLGLDRSRITERVQSLLRLVKLEGFEDRRPDKLSGGQRQRVALARALAREPRLLLLDEPLGALDRTLREETQGELRAIQRRLGTSFMVVTHDPEEAMALADRIVVMDRGRIVQAGPARELYERPASRFVAGLLGDVNLIAGTLEPGEGESRSVCTAFGPLRAVPSPAVASAASETSVVVALRPERLRLGDGDTILTGTLVDVAFLGDRVRRQIRLADGTVLRASTALPGDPGDLGIGQPVSLGFAPEAGWILPA